VLISGLMGEDAERSFPFIGMACLGPAPYGEIAVYGRMRAVGSTFTEYYWLLLFGHHMSHTVW
jgi:hypothetical protein